MATSLTLTAVFEPVENDWVQGRVREFPSVITTAPSIEEARQLLSDALTEYLASLADDGAFLGEAVVAEPLPITVGT